MRVEQITDCRAEKYLLKILNQSISHLIPSGTSPELAASKKAGTIGLHGFG
jgi:hypothetical protein